MKRFGILLYGVFAYLVFFGTFGYLIAFTGNLFVPKTIDGSLQVPLWQALLTNAALIFLFGAQHSIMARSWFKNWWKRIVPEAMERSTFVLVSSLALVNLFYFWQPIGGVVWQINNPFIVGVLWSLFALGYTLVFVSSMLINHFDLFGLRQVWLNFRGKPYTDLKFQTPFLYKYVRHPLYFGILLAFWAAPTMSFARLFFAVLFTTYTLRAIRWEEKDLISHFGDQYRKYRDRVPMLLPAIFGRKAKPQPVYETIGSRKNKEVVKP